jgi:annexin A7/11
LYEAGEKKVGTNEVAFNRIFATESFPHLKAVFEEYQRITGHDLEKAIKSEMSGSVEKAFLAIGATARYAPSYWSNRLDEAMKGTGTHDTSLIRIIVLRSEKDMVEIKQDFQRRFGRTLESVVKADCSGDYERALRCLIGDSNWR